MTTGLLLIAHAPLASALRACVLHVFPDVGDSVAALDVPADAPREHTAARLQAALADLAGLGCPQVLVMTDIFGATPCNVAQQGIDGVHSKLVAGVNLPMVLRTVNYRHEALDALLGCALAGGSQGILAVAVTAPQNQSKKTHDQSHHDHHQ